MCNQKRDGFSLIELLVVVAIIGILASIGIVGYQRYIDSTRTDVAETNADQVARWLSNTGIARAGGLTLDVTACSTASNNTMTGCVTAATTTNGPLATFSNPFRSSATADQFIINAAAPTTCTDAELGNIYIDDGGANLTLTSNTVNVSVCNQIAAPEVAGTPISF